MDYSDFGFSVLDFGLPIRVPSVSMTEEEFKKRTKQVGLRIIALVTALPKNRVADVLGKQLLRSGTSMGANYRAACRGKSVADVVSKLSIVEEEADETLYWMELLTETGTVSLEHLTALMAEVNEILAMTVASIKTLRARK
jgi:four helix bundle protein